MEIVFTPGGNIKMKSVTRRCFLCMQNQPLFGFVQNNDAQGRRFFICVAYSNGGKGS